MNSRSDLWAESTCGGVLDPAVRSGSKFCFLDNESPLASPCPGDPDSREGLISTTRKLTFEETPTSGAMDIPSRNIRGLNGVRPPSSSGPCSGGSMDSLSSSPGSCHVIPQWMPSPRPGMVFQAVRKDGHVVLEEMRAVRPVSFQPVRQNGRLVLRELKHRSSQMPHWQASSTYACCLGRTRMESGASCRRWSMDEGYFRDQGRPGGNKPPLPEKKSAIPAIRHRSPWDAATHVSKPCVPDSPNLAKASKEQKILEKKNSFESVLVDKVHSRGLSRSLSLPTQCGTDHRPRIAVHRSRIAEKPKLADDMAQLLEQASKAKKLEREKNAFARLAEEHRSVSPSSLAKEVQQDSLVNPGQRIIQSKTVTMEINMNSSETRCLPRSVFAFPPTTSLIS